ncbi:hypothetical protein ACH5RR_011854 [Cinchona calisaya]|uniref:C3H1-type domain-containing protein n=1 Tax=Cinchona calisaya TaxID=153742 RepID=A0ABD3A7N8_9GENT
MKGEKMERGKKLESVSWATECNLSQVNLFRSESSPSEVGLKAPDHPQSKVSNSNIVYFDGSHASEAGPSEGRGCANPLSGKAVLHIPQIPWRTPPKLDLRAKFHVAAGEESEEKHRLIRELMAVYNHVSAIPPGYCNSHIDPTVCGPSLVNHMFPTSCKLAHSPLISFDVEDRHFDDRHTPVIPLIAIEEIEEMSFQSNKTAALNIPISLQPSKLPLSPLPTEILCQHKPLLSPEPSKGQNYDITTLQDLPGPMAAVAAAAAAIMKSKDPGSLIDPGLLIKFLSNPKMTQKLVIELGLAPDYTTGTSGSKVFEPSVPQLSSNPSFLIEGCKPTNYGTEDASSSLTVKESPDAAVKPIANAATTETGLLPGLKLVEGSFHSLNSTSASNAASTTRGIFSGWKLVDEAIHYRNSTPSLVKKSFSENIQSANAGYDALPRSVNQLLAANAKIDTGLGPKPVKTSVLLPSLTSNLLNEKSFSEHCQTADAGCAFILKSSYNLSGSTPDSFSKKYTGKHIQLADSGNVVVSRSLEQALGTNTEIGRGTRSKPMTPIVASRSSTSDFPSDQSQNFMSEHSQLINPRNMSGPSVLKSSSGASFGAGTGFGHKGVNDNLPLFGSLSIPKSVHFVDSQPQVPGLKHWNDEHVSHYRARNKYFAGVTPLIPTSLNPNMENFEKPAKEYGSYETLLNAFPETKHPLVPLATPLSGSMEPFMRNLQSAELLPAAVYASLFSSSTTSVPLSKDVNYLKYLIKQHGEEKVIWDYELSQYGQPHNNLHAKDSDVKYQKPCIYYNSSKGCRKGSSCPYPHEIPEQQRSDGAYEVPGTKRMKLGGEFTGRM